MIICWGLFSLFSIRSCTACVHTSFLSMVKWYSIRGCNTLCLFIHQLVDTGAVFPHRFQLDMFSFLLSLYLGVELLKSYSNSMFNHLRNCQTLPKWLRQFTFPPAVYEDFDFSISFPTLVIIWFFDSRYPNRYKVVSHCVFDLHFPDG